MQNNSLVQIKLKANEFIQDYQRQVTQRQYQKQKLKQNIMLEIMSNRHKSQSSQSIGNDFDKLDSISQEAKFKKSTVVTVGEGKNYKDENNNISGLMRSNSVPNAGNRDSQQQGEQNYQPAQITFKMSKNRNNFNLLQSKKQEKDEDQFGEDQEPATNYFDESETLRQAKPRSNKTIEIQQEQIKKSKMSIRNEKDRENIMQKSKKLKGRFGQQKASSDDSQTQRLENIEQQIEIPEKQRPIFLTLDEDQSVQISQENKNKNYAFDIAMQKSQPIDDIEQLRKRKIEQMQKKRQQRMQQFRKLQQIKRLNSEQRPENKRSNSYLKGKASIPSQNSRNEDDFEYEHPKSKSRRKTNERDDKNTSAHNIVQESHYNMKPPQPQRASYVAPLGKQMQYQQTPKTVVSEQRIDKSKGKNTIFRESPKRADKSAGKYSQDPKIEPKQRKNTFIKQSNKKLMITALTNACLPGELNRKQREKLTQVIQKEQSQFFVFLFKQYSRKVIKGIYTLDVSQQFLQKIYGEKAPQEIFSESVQSFYRFDSGSREFKKVDGCKSFSLVVHAIDIA